MTSAVGAYATRTLVKARFDSNTAYTTADNDLIDDLCEGINAYVETTVGRVIAPLSHTEIVLDGYMAEEGGRCLAVPFGLNALTSLEVAAQTGAAFQTIASTDWLLRPLAIFRRAGWPATELRMIDLQQGSVAAYIPPGYGNVRLRGSAGFAGWPAIPDDLQQMAITAVVRAWASRMSGESDIIGVDEYGKPIVSWRIGARDRMILDRYDVHPKIAGGGPVVVAG